MPEEISNPVTDDHYTVQNLIEKFHMGKKFKLNFASVTKYVRTKWHLHHENAQKRKRKSVPTVK